MRFKSLKYKLTFWNTTMLLAAFMLILFIIYVAVNAFLLSNIDKKLDMVASHFIFWSQKHIMSPRIEHSGRKPPPPISKQLILLPPVIFGADNEVLIPSKDEFNTGARPVPLDKQSLNRAFRENKVYVFLYYDEQPVRCLYRQVILKNGQKGVVQAVLSAHELTQFQRIITSILLFMIPIVILLAGGSGVFLTKYMVRPVKNIADTVDKINETGMSTRLEINGEDEFAQLAVTINGMLDRLEHAFKELKEAYRRESQFTSDASHELRTPLTVIKANTSLALRCDRSCEYYQRTLSDIDSAADAILLVIENLLTLARSDAKSVRLNIEEINLLNFLRDIVSVNLPELKKRQVELESIDKDLYFYGDAAYIKRVFFNVIENAVRHTEVNGHICIEAEYDDKFIKIMITDDGCGIAPEHISNLTKRFYRVDKARSREKGGSGLGLAICQSIIDMHNGKLEISSELGKWTKVVIFLPVSPVSVNTDSVISKDL